MQNQRMSSIRLLFPKRVKWLRLRCKANLEPQALECFVKFGVRFEGLGFRVCFPADWQSLGSKQGLLLRFNDAGKFGPHA